MRSPTPLAALVADLERQHGPPPAAFPKRAFELVLWENVAYLANDAKRREAFDALKRTIGTEPERILGATASQLEAVTAKGILREAFAGKLALAARIAIESFHGDVDAPTRLPEKDAKRALRKFPGIGEPGAEKILLFTGRGAFLAPDSNALRVLTRFGLVQEKKNYAQTYALARSLAAEQLGDDRDALLAAHQLLRRHGQEICKRSSPACENCAVAARCEYARPRRGTSGGSR